jgi:YD repeat-containing protein
MTGPNGDQGTTTYDSYGRPSQTTIPDGAVTTYTYTYYNPVTNSGANTQTATVDGRWQTTTLDGFGRTIQVQKGNGSTVVSTVQTQYAPCACSPLGKVSAVSQPYAPNATVYWTTYTYDGSGRTLTVTAPDGASATSYIYTGNSTKVTDPAGSWKTSTVDAYGNLILVTEPNPAGGTFATTYTYTPVNQLTIVSIVRGNVTETRTYVYNGSDLMSATNPENGTVTYTYDLSHHVLTRTDALGQQTVYSYDSYGRLSEVQYYPTRSPYDGTLADTIEQVNYSYDAGQYGVGRLTSVTFDGGVKDSLYDAHAYTYAYTYSQAGRVTNQTVTLQVATGTNFNNLPPVNPPIATFTVGYQWDDEGRMTAMQSPTVTMSSYSSYPNPLVMPTMGYQYDINGRMTEMTSNGNTFAHRELHGGGTTVPALVRRNDGDANVQPHDAVDHPVGAGLPEHDV